MQGWRGSLLAGAAAAALVAAGCGNSESPVALSARNPRTTATTPAPPPAHPHGDRARALLALVRRSDVPARVTEQDNSRNHARCSPRRLFRRAATGIATTPHYATVDAAYVQQSVLLFRDGAAAARAFAQLDSSAKRRCITRYVRRQAERIAGAPLPRPRLLTLTVEPVGQQSSAYRLAIPHDSLLPSVDILVDRIGRALSAVAVEWQNGSTDLDMQEALVRRIAARVRAALTA